MPLDAKSYNYSACHFVCCTELLLYDERVKDRVKSVDNGLRTPNRTFILQRLWLDSLLFPQYCTDVGWPSYSLVSEDAGALEHAICHM